MTRHIDEYVVEGPPIDLEVSMLERQGFGGEACRALETTARRPVHLTYDLEGSQMTNPQPVLFTNCTARHWGAGALWTPLGQWVLTFTSPVSFPFDVDDRGNFALPAHSLRYSEAFYCLRCRLHDLDDEAEAVRQLEVLRTRLLAGTDRDEVA